MKSPKLFLAMLAAAAAAACSESPDKEGAKEPAPTTGPTDVKYVARIDYLLLDKREEETRRETVSQKFEYDDHQRVAQIAEEYDLSWEEKGSHLYRFDYSIADEITVTMTDKANGGALLQKTVAELDEKGRFKKAAETAYDGGGPARLPGEEICTYNSEGRIGKWVSKYSVTDDGNLDNYDENEFFYDAEGLLTRYTYYDSYDDQGFEGAFPAAEFYPNRIASDKSNLDLMFYALAGSSADLKDSQVLFSLLRLTGGGFGTCLPEKMQGFYAPEVSPGDAYEGWHTPNETVHKTYTYVEGTLQEDEYMPLNFTMDADGCITQIAYEIPYAEYLGEYDMVVGDEVLYEEMNQPGYPEEAKRYKYEIKNRKSTKLRDIVNPVTIDIVYR